MLYFKNEDGLVFSYETKEEVGKFGGAGLVPMSEAEISEHIAPVTTTSKSPSFVSMRQARLALHTAGLLQAVEDAIAAMPAHGQTAARIEWDYASTVERSSQFVAMLGAAIGLDDAQLDALFVSAAAL